MTENEPAVAVNVGIPVVDDVTVILAVPLESVVAGEVAIVSVALREDARVTDCEVTGLSNWSRSAKLAVLVVLPSAAKLVG